MNKKTLLVNVSIVILTILICLLLFECCLRVVNPHYLNPMEHEGQIYQSDPVLGIKSIPNSEGKILYHGYGHIPGEVVIYTINSMGLRDNEYVYTKPDNISRIILLGDSFVFGAEVNKSQTIDTYMEQILLDTQVINLGISSFGTTQEYLYLKTEGIKYKPDIVVTFVYIGNDGFDNIGLSPQIETSHLQHRPIINNGSIIYVEFPENKQTKQNKFNSFKDQLRKKSYIYSLISQIYHNKVRLNFGIIGGEYYDFNINIDKQAENTVTSLKMIDDFCKFNNIRHLVVIIPSAELVNEQYLEWEGEEFRNYTSNFKQSILQGIEEYNIDCCDLTPYLRENSIYGHDTLYFNYNNNPGHFTSTGSFLVANKVVEEISKEMVSNDD